MVTQASGTRVTMIHQWRLRWASTPLAWTTEAMGSTMMAEIRPCTAPERTLAMATSQMGHGRLHPVLDLAGEAELLGHDQRHRLHALEEDGDPHHAGDQQGGEGRLGHRTPAAADALADLREHVEEDEAEQERLDQHPDHELDEVLAQHHQVPEDQRPQGDAAGVERRAGGPGLQHDGDRWRRCRRCSSVPQLLAGEIDEDGLQRGLGHREVEHGEPGLLGRRRPPWAAAGPCPSRGAPRPPRWVGSG